MKKRKNRFVNVIVVVCLVMSALLTAAIVYEYHRLDAVMPPAMATALLSVWAGELLLLCVRQILGSDVTHKNKKSNDDEGERI